MKESLFHGPSIGRGAFAELEQIRHRPSHTQQMSRFIALVLALFPLSGLFAAEPAKQRPTDVSFRNEIQRASERGNDFLKSSPNSNGWWSTPDHPSVTALALSAMMGEPNQRHKNSSEAKKGYAFVLACVKADGGIYVTNLANYNTSISMMGLLAAHDPKYDAVLRRARAFVAGLQADLGEQGRFDSPYDGGIGYGSKEGHSDMNNTLTALEALYYSKHLITDKNPSDGTDLNWAAAIQFVQNCQNLPGMNKQEWVSTDAKDRGGFVYDPDSSKAGAVTNANGKVALRSYGSISYAGLLSYIYADVKKSDPRVMAVIDWLQRNYSLEENPGMGPQGYFYYLHLMTKALNAAKVDTLEISDSWRDDLRESPTKRPSESRINRPSRVDWRREVAMRLINLQKADGSWQNENGRWWEKDPNLVTAYAVMSLEIIYGGM
jgi:squalene-hopene/tetraprenyl-beta-curcumene cyclase